MQLKFPEPYIKWRGNVDDMFQILQHETPFKYNVQLRRLQLLWFYFFLNICKQVKKLKKKKTTM